MNYIHKEYYNIKSLKERKEKAKERMNYDSTIRTHLNIKPIDQPEEFELYYVPTNSTIELVSKISKLDIMLENIYDGLPGLAQRNFFVAMLSQELQSSNELEGVRSSKEEIIKTTRKILSDNKPRINKDRFTNVIKSYFELRDGNLRPPLDAKDCRKIYDSITSDGISKDDVPDGKYFRKDVTYIYNNNRQIHRGITSGEKTEELIIQKIDDLLDFMNRSNIDLHRLIKISISHYYFGYIHPFYDENGRTDRFISSIFLKEDYSWLTAMSLSQGCNKDRRKYLSIFDTTNGVPSQGEMNYFVDEFLSIILTGQQIILENLIQKTDLLKSIVNKIESDDSLSSDDEKNIMLVMAEEYHFSSSRDGIGVKELKEMFSYTDATIRKKLRDLDERNLISKVKGRPVKYIISKEYLEA